MCERNILSISGGKDSTAMLLLAIERETPEMECVFADTGNEHQITYDYVQYLNDTVFPIRTIKADFTRQIEGKRKFIEEKWPLHGVSDEKVKRALDILQPTGNPFLDLCLWKGRFPSTKAAFCSQELKREPIIRQVQNPYLEAGADVVSWQGVRADESLNRRFLAGNELKSTHKETGAELWNYRPILTWTAEDCFAMHKKHNIHHNPLYEMGMGRVGCMPCINCRKNEVLEIQRRFPEEFDRIEQWEKLVMDASKCDGATFFAAADGSEMTVDQAVACGNIRQKIEWSKTSRGKYNYDFFRQEDDDLPLCSSIYGLCE